MRKKRHQEKQQKKEQVKLSEVQQRQQEKAIRKTISHLIETLGETDMKPLVQIERIVLRLGVDVSLERLQEAERVEAQGGLPRSDDETKRRTKGGVFFFLVKSWLIEQGRDEDRREIFNRPTGAGKARKETARKAAQEAQAAPTAPLSRTGS